MKLKVVLASLALVLSLLCGCSSDASSTNPPATKPENSGMGDGSALKNKGKMVGGGGEEGTGGGRQIPKGKQ